jgi:hypothetical protein
MMQAWKVTVAGVSDEKEVAINNILQ